MTFLLIAPSLATRCESIFSLMAMWAHPHQAHLASLVEASQCLVLLADEGPDWPYAFIQINNAMLHAMLSSKGHLGILTEGKPQRNPCSLLHQLQAWRLLQNGKWMVCPGGLNAGLNALVFYFRSCHSGTQLPLMKLPETPPWYRWTSVAWNPRLLVPPQCHPFSLLLNPSLILPKPLTSIFRGALDRLHQTFPAPSMPVSQHSTPGRKLPLAALGAPPQWEQKTHSGCREQTQPHPSHWPLPHRHHSMWQHPKMSPYCSNQSLTISTSCIKNSDCSQHSLHSMVWDLP